MLRKLSLKSFSLLLGSGGISLKPSPSMDAMRADMGGAATVCASIVTAAALKLPINIIGNRGFRESINVQRSHSSCNYSCKVKQTPNLSVSTGYNQSGLAPLCENMPSGKATKPGDVVTAKNGKTIQVCSKNPCEVSVM